VIDVFDDQPGAVERNGTGAVEAPCLTAKHSFKAPSHQTHVTIRGHVVNGKMDIVDVVEHMTEDECHVRDAPDVIEGVLEANILGHEFPN